MILGMLSGLSAALVWSTSSLMIKAQAGRIDTLSFNTFRILVSALAFLLLLVIFGGIGQLFGLESYTYLALAISVILGLCFGDTLYFWSMSAIGASRAMALSGIYPLFTWMLAVPLLGEKVDWLDIAGTLLILAALFALARGAALTEANEFVLEVPEKEPVVPAPRASLLKSRRTALGMAAAVMTAFLWAASTTALAIGLSEEASVLVVSAFRYLVAGLVLLPPLYWLRRGRPWRNYTRASLPQLIALALFSSALGTLLFVWAVQYAGAARTALLVTASPLVGVPLAAIFLKERVARGVWVGTGLAVLGVWLVLL
jgi:drug/metabolite transporter (DMT)-like permease